MQQEMKIKLKIEKTGDHKLPKILGDASVFMFVDVDVVQLYQSMS